MENAAKPAFVAGLLIAVLSPLLALVLYPRANWLFLGIVIGIILLLLAFHLRKEPTPSEVAQCLELILQGQYGRWDVDDYEHLNPKDPRVRDLWKESMQVGGLPEEWLHVDGLRKNRLRTIAERLKDLDQKKL